MTLHVPAKSVTFSAVEKKLQNTRRSHYSVTIITCIAFSEPDMDFLLDHYGCDKNGDNGYKQVDFEILRHIFSSSSDIVHN